MFSKHVTKNLSAYCHGEVAAEESRRIAEHLIGCNRCRGRFEEIKLGVKLAERLPQLAAPDSLWVDFQSRVVAETSHSRIESSKQSRFSFKLRQPGFAGVAAGLLLSAVLGAWWFYSRESRPFWEVARLNGSPRIGSSRMDEKGRLAVGEWLETDGSSRAKIEVGSIGHVEIDPNTRVRLIETKPTEHRLELARGKMSAKIWAPPRLFFVDTPSAVAADLGCAYSLEVDDAGRGLLHVTAGYVALEDGARESAVPAGAACLTKPGAGPGTPFFEDAPAAYVAALARYDFAGDRAALDTLLDGARPRDTLTLWHLLSRANDTDRARVYERLAALAPPPDGVTREGVLQLDRAMLDAWKD